MVGVLQKKQILGTQCTIAWYVDENKLLHKNTEMIFYIIYDVKKRVGELSAVRVTKHAFLRINV